MSDVEQTDSAIETENNSPDATQNDASGPTGLVTSENGIDAHNGESGQFFTRDYVDSLRKENAGYRTKAKEHSQRLHTELVRATGKLADPTDLPYSEDHLTDPAALAAAIDQLIETKPHLRARTISGNVGQGQQDTSANVDLAALLRSQV